MKKRYLSIEFFKGLGIIYLIALHELVWLYLNLGTGQLRFTEVSQFFHFFCYRSGLHVLGFQVPLLAGITFFISNFYKKPTWTQVYKRAILLLFVGFSINFLCWGVWGIPDWDVLQFIALSMMISWPILRWLPNGWNVLVILGMGIFTLLLADKFPLIEFKRIYLYAITIGSSEGIHYWPLCPWFFVFALGLGLGYAFIKNSVFLWRTIFSVGLVFILLSVIAGDFFPKTAIDAIWGVTLFKPSPFFILGITGCSIIFITVFEYLVKRVPQFRKMVECSFIVMTGRSILWVFIINTIIGYHVTHYLINNMAYSYVQSLLIYATLIVLTIILGCVITYVVSQYRKLEYE